MSPGEYYKTFVLSYLQNAIDKFKTCRILEVTETPERIMIRSNSITSIIFSAMTLEAFCNHCIDQFLESLSKNGRSPTVITQMKDYFDGLPISDKWKELFKHKDPNFIGSISVDWTTYKELLGLRNTLVHSAPRSTGSQFRAIDELQADDARKALEIVNRMMTHGTRMFTDLIPTGTYSPATFEPTLKRIYPQEVVQLSRILDEPFQVATSNVPSFEAIGPREYVVLLDMHDLVPPDQFPLFRIQPLVFTSSSNDGLARLEVCGWKMDHAGIQ